LPVREARLIQRGHQKDYFSTYKGTLGPILSDKNILKDIYTKLISGGGATNIGQDQLIEARDLVASNIKLNQVLQDDKFKKTFKIYMKHGATSRRQMSQVQNSLEGGQLINFEEIMMSVERKGQQEEDAITNIETVTEVSKAPSGAAVVIAKKNESPSKRKLSELPELKAKT